MKPNSFWQRSDLTVALWTLRRECLVVGVFSMVTNVLMLAPTLYMLQVYDRVMVSRSELTLLAMSLLTLFFFGMAAFAEWSRSRLLVRSSLRLDGLLSTRVFNASFEASLSTSQTRPARAFSDLTELRQFLTGQGIFAFFDAPWTPIYIAVLFFLHPFLGWVAIGFALIQALLAWLGHQRTIQPSQALSQAQNDVHAYLHGKLQNAEVVEAMGMLESLRCRWQQRQQAYLAQHGRTHGLMHRITAWSKFVRYSQQSLALGAGALLVIDGQLSPGGMIAANVLMSRALAPIDQMVGTWRNLIGARGAFERLEQLLLTHPERGLALKHTPPRGMMALRGVVARAPGRREPILKGVSLTMAVGSVTVVLGPSGSGKSTLARVLMNIWPDVQGDVLLDERPMSCWNRIQLGPYLGYLPQDIELFDGTIAENIARFSDLDSSKVIAAAQAAGLHEMILRFSKGYDTPIGEAGHLLSGGQRQRIGLARAMYGDPALIVLDEPNANLDEVGELALIQAVRELKTKGKTVVLITHRPAVLAVADQVVVLHEGQVKSYGSRDEVLTQLRAAKPVPAAQVPSLEASAT